MVQENVRKYQSESERLAGQLAATTFTLRQTEGRVDSIRNIPLFGEKILSEIKPLFPQIAGCSYAETYLFSTVNDSTQRTGLVPMVVFTLPATGCGRPTVRASRSGSKTDWATSM